MYVRNSIRIFLFEFVFVFRLIYQILKKIENYVLIHYKNKENILNVKVFLLFAMLNINHYLLIHQVKIFRCRTSSIAFFFVFLAEPFEPYVPPEGDGKATLMSKDVRFRRYMRRMNSSNFICLEIKSILYIIKNKYRNKKTF